MRIFLVLILLVALGAGCSGGTEYGAIPRRTAYPRPTLPDTAMSQCESAPLYFLVNAQAVTSSEKEGWVTVAYPGLGAKMFVTFTATSPSEVDMVKANRMERLMLNCGDRPSSHTEFVNRHGFRALVVGTDGISTPVQFLASDDSIWVVSGAVYFADPKAAEASDSIRPMAEAISDDVFRALNNLK